MKYLTFYVKAIRILAIIMFVVAAALSIYYYIEPSKFAEGTVMNALGSLVRDFGSVCMLFLGVILSLWYKYLLEREPDELIKFTPTTLIIYIILIAHSFFRCWRPPYDDIGGFTPKKIMIGMAIAMVLNYSLILITSNYLKMYEGGGQDDTGDGSLC